MECPHGLLVAVFFARTSAARTPTASGAMVWETGPRNSTQPVNVRLTMTGHPDAVAWVAPAIPFVA